MIDRPNNLDHDGLLGRGLKSKIWNITTKFAVTVFFNSLVIKKDVIK